MSTDDRNNNLFNQMLSSLMGPNTPDITRYCAIAGAAFLGGALYYYMHNNNSSLDNKLIDFNNQTREIEVCSIEIFIKLNAN